MSRRRINRRDYLHLVFESRERILTSPAGWLDDLLAIVERNAGEWMPTKANAKRRVRYSREAIKKQFFQRDAKDGDWSLHLVTEGTPESLLSFNFLDESPWDIHFRFTFWLEPFDFYREAPHAEERARRLVSFVRDMAHRFTPYYAHAHSEADLEMGTLGRDLPTRACDPHWLDVFGKEMVDAMGGRERVLSTPAALVEELPHGGVLLLTRPTPADFDSEEGRIAQARALVHLRPDLSFDDVLSRLREQSAALVPVARNWDPDVEELLNYTMQAVPLKDLQRETARLNAHWPPPVSEWMPLEDAPGTDVEDLAAALAEYAEHAEVVVALWYKDVPELWDENPGSITALDQHLWRFAFGTKVTPEALEQHLIPAVGAYLGDVMVNQLGGRWVPRKKLDEAYVALGERAWMPFLRVRHCLGDEQAVLSNSLIKFYREAERHVRALQAEG